MQAVLEAALSNVLTALPLALAAWGAARAQRPPALVHGLWLLVLLKLVTPPLFRVPIELPAAPVRVEAPAPVESFDPSTLGAAELDELVEALSAASALESSAPQVPTTELAPSEPFPWLTALAVVWLLGACATWAFAAQRIRLFSSLIALSSRAPARIEGEARALARKLGLARVPELRVVPARLAPMLWSAGGRAQLVLPEELLPRLDRDARRALLAHELAHFKRRDHLVRWLELFVRGLHWWNPLARWSVRGLRSAEEACCDAWVVWALPGAERAYAGALVETADFLSGSAAIPDTGAGAFSHARELERRLTMILNADTSKSLSRRGRLGLLAIGLAALPFLPAFSQPQGTPESAREVAEMEARVADVQARRAVLEARLAELAAAGNGLRPAHSKAQELQREMDKVEAEAQTMDRLLAQLSGGQDFVLGRGPVASDGGASAPAADERRSALKAGAEALAAQGDAHGSQVLLDMLAELESRSSLRYRISDARMKQLAALGYLNAQQQNGADPLLEYRKLLGAYGKLDRTDPAPAPGAGGTGAGGTLGGLYGAGGGQNAPAPAPAVGSDGRIERLEQRIDDLTRLVERLAQSLEQRAPRGGGGAR